jgi:hypothetical protein
MPAPISCFSKHRNRILDFLFPESIAERNSHVRIWLSPSTIDCFHRCTHSIN